MIVDLPNTTTSAISKTLVKIREEGGAVALGRVLTLVIATRLGEEEEATRCTLFLRDSSPTAYDVLLG